VVRQLHKPQTDLEMDWMMSPEELFKIEQQRIHEDLAQALFESEKLREEEQRNGAEEQKRWEEEQKRWEEEQKRWEEEQRRCEDLEREVARLRQLLGDLDSSRDS